MSIADANAIQELVESNGVKIEQGNRYLEDIVKLKPKTKVNHKAAIKYPVTDLVNGFIKEEVVEEDVTYTNPHPYFNPDSLPTEDANIAAIDGDEYHYNREGNRGALVHDATITKTEEGSEGDPEGGGK